MEVTPSKRKPSNFEEVKLVLALVIQKKIDDISNNVDDRNLDLDGAFGRPGGYDDILRYMIEAKRYEQEEEEEYYGYDNDNIDDYEWSDDEPNILFVQDMQDRFDLIADNTSYELRDMRSLLDDYYYYYHDSNDDDHDNDDDANTTMDIDYIRRRCCGLVLEAMGFVENGF